MHNRGGKVRAAIALEAARLMYREGISQYFDAKRVAAKRVLGKSGARAVRFRPKDLPSNGEIRSALLGLVQLSEGSDRTQRLFAMRIEALQVMRALHEYNPRLIGSVWSGHARRGSDIDLHVFVESREMLEQALQQMGWAFDAEEVTIRVGSTFRVFHHLHLRDRLFAVELSVYRPSEQRIATVSSTDGKRIDRVSASRLEACLQGEHLEDWLAWCRTGELGWAESEQPPGAYDGWLTAHGFVPSG